MLIRYLIMCFKFYFFQFANISIWFVYTENFSTSNNSRCKYYNKIFQSRINSNGHISIQHLKIHIFNNFIHIFRLQILIQLSCMRMHFQQPSHSPGLIRNIPVSRRVSSRQDARDNSPAKLTTK